MNYKCSYIKPGHWEQVGPDVLFPQVLVASFFTLPPTYRHPIEGGVVTDAPTAIRLVTHGELTVHANGTPPKVIRQGDLCVTFPGDTSFRVSGSTSASMYQASFFSAPPPLHQGVPFLPGYGFIPEKIGTGDDLDKFVEVFEAIISRLIALPANYQSVTTARLIDLINMIFDRAVEKTHPSDMRLGRWGHIIGQLEISDTPPNIRALAETMHMSTDHFIRAFRKCTGHTPKHYYQQKRLWKARKMLISGKSVKETAFTCGFANQSYFSKAFKRYFGIPPSQCSSSGALPDAQHPALPISRNFYIPGMNWQKLRVPKSGD